MLARPVDDGDMALRVLGERGAALHPVAVVVIGDAAEIANLGSVDMAAHDAVDMIRSLRSALHGFVSLEAAGGFGLPQDIDKSFEALITVVTAGILRVTER